VPLDHNHSTPPLCDALSSDSQFIGRCVRRDCVADVGCTDDVTDGDGAVCSAGDAAVGATASDSVDGFASALALSLFSERRLNFLTEWMVDTLRRWDTFLSLFELLVAFLQMSVLGAASTDMLLSLPMLLLESSSESFEAGVPVSTLWLRP
jgi:hypothetical protein